MGVVVHNSGFNRSRTLQFSESYFRQPCVVRLAQAKAKPTGTRLEISPQNRENFRVLS